MGFIARLDLAEAETWPNVNLAAEQRYWDAFALATSTDNDYRTGAIYLMGYVAEMLLKTATCRVVGVRDNLPIRPDTKIAAGASVQTLHYGTHDTQVSWVGKKNYHSLDALSRTLIDARVSCGMAFTTQFATQVRFHALAVSANWSEALRYKASRANDTELNETYASVTWFRTNYESLWK